MFFNQIPLEHFRKTEPVGNWGEPTWVLLATTLGTPQPFEGVEGVRNFQNMQNCTDMITVDDPTYNVRKDDEFRYGGITYRVMYAQNFNNGLIPHTEIYVQNAQWAQA